MKTTGLVTFAQFAVQARKRGLNARDFDDYEFEDTLTLRRQHNDRMFLPVYGKNVVVYRELLKVWVAWAKHEAADKEDKRRRLGG